MEDVLVNFFTTVAWAIPVLIILGVIDLILRGIALWHSARRGQTVWFVFLFIINSVGILPIIYLLINRGKKEDN
jgi:predicted small integral membrane protein